MSVDQRRRHNEQTRREAAALFESGLGYRPVAEDGHRRHGAQAILGEGVLRADLRVRQQGDRHVEHVDEPRHGPTDGPARPVPSEDARRRDPLSCTATWAGSASTRRGRVT